VLAAFDSLNLMLDDVEHCDAVDVVYDSVCFYHNLHVLLSPPVEGWIMHGTVFA
jgi:hypothetical protein